MTIPPPDYMAQYAPQALLGIYEVVCEPHGDWNTLLSSTGHITVLEKIEHRWFVVQDKAVMDCLKCLNVRAFSCSYAGHPVV